MGFVKHTSVNRGALFPTIQVRHFEGPTSDDRFVCENAILAEAANPLSCLKPGEWR